MNFNDQIVDRGLLDKSTIKRRFAESFGTKFKAKEFESHKLHPLGRAIPALKTPEGPPLRNLFLRLIHLTPT